MYISYFLKFDETSNAISLYFTIRGKNVSIKTMHKMSVEQCAKI